MFRTRDNNGEYPAARSVASDLAAGEGGPLSMLRPQRLARTRKALRASVRRRRFHLEAVLALPLVRRILLAEILALLPLLQRRGLRSLWVSIQHVWLRRSPLFDAAYYRAQYPDVAAAGMPPLLHFIRHGHGEGRSPHPVFDTAHYREQLAATRERQLNPLIHYKLAGAARRLAPSPWFDFDVYLEHNPDVRRAGVDPFVHFCRHGLKENRRASHWFDPRAYLRARPSVAASGVPALEHFLRTAAGDAPLPDEFDPGWQTGPKPGAVAIDYAERLRALPPRTVPQAAEVDVVVPVFRGVQETLACLYHVLTADNATGFRLIVVDDASPEEGLPEILTELAGRGLFELLRNEASRGFCHSINRGLAADAQRDVVILNSDTEVYGDWIDRLRRAAYSRPRIATATPMTNNGTIASYPRFCRDNPVPLELGYAELDRLFAEVNAGATADVPTAVGFCTYIRRAALDEIGLFDAATFGRGYGEENDFCRRGQALGWKDVIAGDVFVRHIGGMSFRGERHRRVEQALKILDRRYPDYRRTVRDFIARDPLRPLRARIDMARLRYLSRDRNILMVSHMRGGGTEQNVQEITRRFAEEGASVFHLRAAPASRSEVRLFHSEAQSFPNAGPFFLGDKTGNLAVALRELRIDEAHVHHLMDFAADAADRFRLLFGQAAIPYVFTAHDYAAVCPRINLVGADSVYCGEPGPAGCRTCLKRNGNEHGLTEIGHWRDSYSRFLAAARRVVVPSTDVERRLRRYFPEAAIVVEPHETIAPAALKPPRGGRDPLRIGIIGAISPIKGLEVIRRCAMHARRARLPLEFVIIGYSSNDEQMRRHGVTTTGIYYGNAAQELIEKREIDLVWLPSVWPETYSYTLSIALQTGLPIAAFDLGAIAERLRATDRALIMPLSRQADPAFLCREFLSFNERRLAVFEAGAAAQ